MLHALYGVYDKYPYAHTQRTRSTQSQPRTQAGRTHRAPAVPGPCATVLALCHHTLSGAVLTGPVWLILPNHIKLYTILTSYKFRPLGFESVLLF